MHLLMLTGKSVASMRSSWGNSSAYPYDQWSGLAPWLPMSGLVQEETPLHVLAYMLILDIFDLAMVLVQALKARTIVPLTRFNMCYPK